MILTKSWPCGYNTPGVRPLTFRGAPQVYHGLWWVNVYNRTVHVWVIYLLKTFKALGSLTSKEKAEQSSDSWPELIRWQVSPRQGLLTDHVRKAPFYRCLQQFKVHAANLCQHPAIRGSRASEGGRAWEEKQRTKKPYLIQHHVLYLFYYYFFVWLTIFLTQREHTHTQQKSSLSLYISLHGSLVAKASDI